MCSFVDFHSCNVVHMESPQISLTFNSLLNCDNDRRHEVRQENPLNLSISVSGGKEINKDSVSKGD